MTGIRLPLYDTAGATSLIFPALRCCELILSLSHTEYDTIRKRSVTSTSTTTSRAVACGWENVSAMLLIGPNGTLRETLTPSRVIIRKASGAHPSPLNSESQWSRVFCIKASVISLTRALRFSTRARLLANRESFKSSGMRSTCSASFLNWGAVLRRLFVRSSCVKQHLPVPRFQRRS